MKTMQQSKDDKDPRSPKSAASTTGAGPRDENSVVTSLSALIAVEEAASTKAPRKTDASKGGGSGVIDIPGLAANGGDERASYLDLFPFGAPSEQSPYRAPDLTPVPAELFLAPTPTQESPRRTRWMRAAAIGGMGAAIAATLVWFGTAGEAPRAAVARTGVRPAAHAAQASLPRIDAPDAAVEALSPFALGAKERALGKKGTKESTKQSAGGQGNKAKAGAGKSAAKSPAARPKAAGAASPAAPPPAQKSAPVRPSGDGCNGDLNCAMQRALGSP